MFCLLSKVFELIFLKCMLLIYVAYMFIYALSAMLTSAARHIYHGSHTFARQQKG